ncbi:unnamed protein product [Calypogeia fissa]
MEVITYRYLIAFALHHGLSMHQMDIVTAYLYGNLDKTIYMEAPPELIARVAYYSQGEHKRKQSIQNSESSFGHTDEDKLKSISRMIQWQADSLRPADHALTAKRKFSVQVFRSMYGLKQSGRTWYHRFHTEMIAMGFSNSEIAPCVFIKREGKELMIVAIYVDDLNMFGTNKIMLETIKLLKRSFEMRDMGKTTFCLGLQFEHLHDGVLLHQSTYTKRILKQFNMLNVKTVRSPMDLRSLDKDKDIFRKREEQEPLLGSEKPYLSAIRALLFLSNQTRPDITFAVSLLARHSSQPTIRHWNGLKRIFCYLSGTADLGLYYPKHTDWTLVGYADAGYLSDPADAKSQTGYVFQMGPTAISWWSTKQTLATTSSNHSEIIALYEASRECLWLRNLIDHISDSAGMQKLNFPAVIFEDNRSCVEQITSGFIKGEKTKHIAPKFFFAHEQNGHQMNVQWIASSDNTADLLTKPLPPAVHETHSYSMGLRSLTKLLQEAK